MKKIFLLAFTALTIVYSCSNKFEETDVDNTNINSENETILKFASQAEFDTKVALLNTMNSEQIQAWADSSKFKSLYKEFSNAMKETSSITSAKEYNDVKSKYADVLYFPEVNGDCGPYLPLKNEKIGVLLNANGEVIIADEKIKMKDINTYQQLVDLKRTIPSKNTTRSGGINNYAEVQEGLRWIWIQVTDYPLCSKEASYIQFVFNFRKYVANLGWVNFNGWTYMDGDFTFTNSRGVGMKLPRFTQNQQGFSPHIYNHAWPESYGPQAVREFLTTSVWGCFNLYHHDAPGFTGGLGLSMCNVIFPAQKICN